MRQRKDCQQTRKRCSISNYAHVHEHQRSEQVQEQEPRKLGAVEEERNSLVSLSLATGKL